MLDLPEHYRLMLVKILLEYASGYEVLAYGSRLNGTSHSTSDLDLVIRHLANPQTEYPRMSGLREALRESNIPILVDVVDWARIPEEFRQEIARQHQKVFPV